MANFNWVDYVVIGIFFASILAGLMRGLIKELIALLTWITAFILAGFYATRLATSFTSSEQVRSAVTEASTNTGVNAAQSASLLAIGISFVCIFLGVIIAGKLINYFVSSAVEGRGISIGNRLLGALFGLARGVLLVLLIMFLVNLSPISEQYYWKGSQFVNSFKPAVKWISDTVQPGLASIKAKMSQKLQNVNQQYLQGAGNAVFNVFPDRG